MPAQDPPSAVVVYLATQWFCDDDIILGVFSTPALARAACGESQVEWEGTDAEGWRRDEEWGPEGDFQHPLMPGVTTRTRALLRWASAVSPYTVDVQDMPRGSPDPWS